MTDTLTVSRELLRQAIEALNEADNVLTSSMFAEAATALRAALEQPAPVQEQQFTADELDLMRQWFESMQDTNRSFVIDADKKLHQKIIAAIQAAPRAEQPRKAVKLSDSEILTALDVEYVSSAQNRELFLSDARTIEQAVWAKLGVEK